MFSESERIRKAVQRVLGPPPAEGPAPLEGLDEDAQAIHRDGELPPRIMAKVPAYLAFLNEFLHVGQFTVQNGPISFFGFRWCRSSSRHCAK